MFLGRFKMVVLPIFFSFFFFAGCNKEEYVVIDPSYIYKPDTPKIQGQYIFIEPHLPYDVDFNYYSRDYYQAMDTILTFKGYREKMNYQDRQSLGWCMLDWRINSIDVITLVDYDSAHPEGSSLNDLLGLKYYYKFQEIERPLSVFKYGDLMLADYYPYRDNRDTKGSLYLFFLDQDKPWLKAGSYEVHIEDAFGRSFVLKQ